MGNWRTVASATFGGSNHGTKLVRIQGERRSRRVSWQRAGIQASLQHHPSTSGGMTPILQIKKLRFREVNDLPDVT